MRPSKRELLRKIQKLKDDDAPSELNIESEFVEITDEMTDENGDLIDDKLPDGMHPSGEFVLETDSDVVTVHADTGDP